MVTNSTNDVITYDKNMTSNAIEPITLLLVETSLALGVGRNENKSITPSFLTQFGWSNVCLVEYP